MILILWSDTDIKAQGYKNGCDEKPSGGLLARERIKERERIKKLRGSLMQDIDLLCIHPDWC